MAAVLGSDKKMKFRTKLFLHSIGAGCALCGALLGLSIWDLNRRVKRAAKCLSDESTVERNRYIVPPDSVVAALSAAQREQLGEPRSQSYSKWYRFPYILLRLAECDNKKLRELAFRRLLQSTEAMTNADYCQIAQAASFKTLLELARFANADSRFFLEPKLPNFAAARRGDAPTRFDEYRQRYFAEDNSSALETFEERIRDLLKMLLVQNDAQPRVIDPNLKEADESNGWFKFATGFLSTASRSSSSQQPQPLRSDSDAIKFAECRCCRYLSQLAIDRTEPENQFFEQEGFVGTELPDAMRRDPLSNEEARLVVLLGALHAQSAHAERARRLVAANVTLVLRDLILATQSPEIHRVVARIMLNLTASFRSCSARDEQGMRELVRHVSSGRWLSILNDWFTRRPDPYLSLYAANALANLSVIVAHLDALSAAADESVNVGQIDKVDLFRDGLYLLYPLHRNFNELHSAQEFREQVKARAFDSIWQMLAKLGIKIRFTTAHASSKSPPKADGQADIVVVHGLLGGVLRTWRARECPDPRTSSLEQLFTAGVPLTAVVDSVEASKSADCEPLANRRKPLRDKTLCWPKDWLPYDLPNARIVGIDYDTSLSRWQRACPYDEERYSLEARAASILKQLERAGIGRDRPVIWIAHSLGGLLVKQILVLASKRRLESAGDTQRDYFDALVRNTKGCVFYAVPHLGTDFARQFTRYRMLLSLSTEVEQLSSDSRHLDALNADFRKLILREDIAEIDPVDGASQGLPLNLEKSKPLVAGQEANDSKPNILSLLEREELLLWKYKTLIVPQHTADGGLGGEHVIVPEDHQRVCKPASPDSPNYVEVVRFIKKSLQIV